MSYNLYVKHRHAIMGTVSVSDMGKSPTRLPACPIHVSEEIKKLCGLDRTWPGHDSNTGVQKIKNKKIDLLTHGTISIAYLMFSPFYSSVFKP